MPILFDASLPDELAFRSNREAIQADDARKSREAFEKHVREDSSKYVRALRSRIILFALISIFFFILLALEWMVSKPIYEVMAPKATWLPFAIFIGVGIFISACLGENMSTSLLTGNIAYSGIEEDQNLKKAVDGMYKRKRKFNWLLNPYFGIILGLAFLYGIYFVSMMRVDLMKKAGDMSSATASFHAYIPVVLYALDIIFGIPTFLFLLWGCNVLHVKNLGNRFAQERDQEIILSQSAVKRYEGYVAQLSEYNLSGERDGRMPRPLIPPNQVLRRLLIEAGHSDMDEIGTQSSYSETPPNHPNRVRNRANIIDMNPPNVNRETGQENRDKANTQNSQDDQTPPNHSAIEAEEDSSNANREDTQQYSDEDNRVDDLINLLDEQISRQNHGL